MWVWKGGGGVEALSVLAWRRIAGNANVASSVFNFHALNTLNNAWEALSLSWQLAMKWAVPCWAGLYCEGARQALRWNTFKRLSHRARQRGREAERLIPAWGYSTGAGVRLLFPSPNKMKQQQGQIIPPNWQCTTWLRLINPYNFRLVPEDREGAKKEPSQTSKTALSSKQMTLFRW